MKWRYDTTFSYMYVYVPYIFLKTQSICSSAICPHKRNENFRLTTPQNEIMIYLILNSGIRALFSENEEEKPPGLNVLEGKYSYRIFLRHIRHNLIMYVF